MNDFQSSPQAFLKQEEKLEEVDRKHRQRPAMPLITLVIPVKDEEDAIAPFLAAIDRDLASLDARLEILFVDDGSTDATVAQLAFAAQNDPRIRFLKLSRNFGKESAMTAGLEHAQGDAVVPMDVDLQDPPALIHEFLAYWRKGYDTVYGMRESRLEDSRRKRASAGMFYRVFNKVSDTHIPSNAGDFRLIDRRVVRALAHLPERGRFMKGLFAWPGFSSIGVPYARPARETGITKFNYWRLWNFALDGLTSFSTWPLRIWTYVGVGVALVALVYMFILIGRTLASGIDIPGYASLMSAVLFFGAMQLISIGVLGEYLGRLYMESKQRPIYLVDFDSATFTSDATLPPVPAPSSNDFPSSSPN